MSAKKMMFRNSIRARVKKFMPIIKKIMFRPMDYRLEQAPENLVVRPGD